ncbi:MAG: HAD family hydrolase [Ignavibacteriae bacterium]|nr:HAD family hydrolase [Ignavibacteriota bacterium]
MIRAVTIDFWNTLVDTSNGEARRRARNAALRDLLHTHRVAWDDDLLAAGMKHIYAAFERTWFDEKRTPSADESVAALWAFLNVSVAADEHARVVTVFEDSILLGMPALLPGAADALERLAATRRLAVISDTAFSPGRVLRAVLEHHDVARHFSTMVFSDETGVSKPHLKAFTTALSALGADAGDAVHIGDIERTDIDGALDAGMQAILFRGDPGAMSFNGDAPTRAQAVAWSWDEVPGIIERLSGVM